MPTLTEAEVEAVLLDHLGALGYTCINDAVSGPDGRVPQRAAYSDTFLPGRLRDAIAHSDTPGRPALDARQTSDIEAFLRTLTDGHGERRPWPPAARCGALDETTSPVASSRRAKHSPGSR